MMLLYIIDLQYIIGVLQRQTMMHDTVCNCVCISVLSYVLYRSDYMSLHKLHNQYIYYNILDLDMGYNL